MRTNQREEISCLYVRSEFFPSIASELEGIRIAHAGLPEQGNSLVTEKENRRKKGKHDLVLIPEKIFYIALIAGSKISHLA